MKKKTILIDYRARARARQSPMAIIAIQTERKTK